MKRKFFFLLLSSLSGFAALQLHARSPVTQIYDYQSTFSNGVSAPLNLKAELNYDSSVTNAPVAVVMHGYSPSTGNFANVRASAQRLRDKGFFVISVAMRGRDGSEGTRDSGGVEIYDIYDAIQAVGNDFSSHVDMSNLHITGYSGGGGNVMSALTKFPDLFRVGSSFFGMSDYGYDLTHGWYNNGAAHRTSQLDIDIGNPNSGGSAVLDRYHARASNLASQNNPYSEIHLFTNHDETISPIINHSSYRDNAVAAESYAGEFNNIHLHTGGLGEFEDFNDNGFDEADEAQDWPHQQPTADQQNAAESWYIDRLLSGSIAQPTLNASDELFVAGFVKTQPFELWLGDGQDAAGLVDYSILDGTYEFELTLLSSDLSKTGALTISTSGYQGQNAEVWLNGSLIGQSVLGNSFTYSGLAHGDILQLTVIPEPFTYALLLGGGSLLVVLRRKGGN